MSARRVFLARSRAALGAAAILILVIGPAVPPASAAGGQSLDLTMALGSAYDSNLLQYSDDQRALFEDGTRPLRFSIESLNDLTWSPSLGLAWELDQGRGRRHALRLRGDGDFHQRNGTADWRAESVSWRESFHGNRRLTVGWYALPHYYLRQLYDDDVTPPLPGLTDFRYHRAQFDLGIGSASWSQRVTRGTRMTLGYQYEQRRYNADFRARDSKTHQGLAELAFTRLPRRGGIKLSGGWRASAAEGSDGDEAPGTAADDPDVSYRGFVGGAGGRLEFARRGTWRFGSDLAWELGTRHYTSSRATDKYYFGRDDVSNAVEAGLRAQWRPHWSARGFYRFETKDARLGASAPATTDVGSYRRHLVGLAIEWSATLWRASAASEEESDE